MKRSGPSLRRRITAAYVLLACFICGGFALAGYASIKTIENELINRRLESAADRLIERHWSGTEDLQVLGVAFYNAGNIPDHLRGFAPGIREIAFQGKSLHVLVRDDHGSRFVLVDDESQFEAIEQQMYLVLAVAFLACLLLAWLLGRVTASRVMAPVTGLASAVEAGTPELPSMDSPDEMGVLARAFAARTRDLQGYLARERWFTGDVSHELRTPLTVIIGASEVLAAESNLHPWAAAAVERIRRTASDASERVSAMLLLSRAPETLGAPRIALRPVIQQELERHQHLLRGKAVECILEADQEVHVFARPELAAIAIGNLVRNAFQFTEEGSVAIRLRPDHVVIEDSGPGLSPRIRERLFQRFVHGPDEGATGSGLGLAIVRRVADHLGWSIRLEDRQPGPGTRFVVTFPASTS